MDCLNMSRRSPQKKHQGRGARVRNLTGKEGRVRVSLCLIREEVKIKNRQRATELLLVEGLFWEGGFGEGDPGFVFFSVQAIHWSQLTIQPCSSSLGTAC